MPDGETALAWISEHPCDLLLADVVMPGIDGIELARRAADMWPHLRIIFITGFAAVALSARPKRCRARRPCWRSRSICGNS